MPDLTLYELQGCPRYVEVKDRLSDLGLEYGSRMVPSVHAGHEEIEEISGQTGVPVLVDEEHGVEGMSESDGTVNYLGGTYGSAA